MIWLAPLDQKTKATLGQALNPPYFLTSFKVAGFRVTA
jgi:hypothetical protein